MTASRTGSPDLARVSGTSSRASRVTPSSAYRSNRSTKSSSASASGRTPKRDWSAGLRSVIRPLASVAAIPTAVWFNSVCSCRVFSVRVHATSPRGVAPHPRRPSRQGNPASARRASQPSRSRISRVRAQASEPVSMTTKWSPSTSTSSACAPAAGRRGDVRRGLADRHDVVVAAVHAPDRYVERELLQRVVRRVVRPGGVAEERLDRAAAEAGGVRRRAGRARRPGR